MHQVIEPCVITFKNTLKLSLIF